MKKNILLALTHEQLTLLKNSEETKDVEAYGSLYTAVGKYEKLTKDDLNKDVDFDEKARLTLTLGQKEMFEKIALEWRAYNYEDVSEGQEIKCQLCNAPNTFIYHLVNDINKTELNLDSRCVMKFPEIEGYAAIRTIQRRSDQAKVEIKRAIAINTVVPEIVERLENYKTDYREFAILLPWKIYAGLDKQMSVLQKMYETFVKRGSVANIDKFKVEYDAAIIPLLQLFAQADEIKLSNINLKIACKRDEYMWLKEGGNIDVLENISKNDGFYNIETVTHMISHKFLDDMKTDIERSCIGTELKLKAIRYEEKRVSFDVEYPGSKGLTEVYVTYSDFMKNIGCHIFFDSSYKIKMDTNIFKITNYPQNLEAVMNRVNKALVNLDEKILYTYDDDIQVLYFDRKTDNTYKKIGVQLFLDKYMPRIKMNEDLLKKEYLNEYRHLNRSGNWKKISDRTEMRENRKII